MNSKSFIAQLKETIFFGHENKLINFGHQQMILGLWSFSEQMNMIFYNVGTKVQKDPSSYTASVSMTRWWGWDKAFLKHLEEIGLT